MEWKRGVRFQLVISLKISEDSLIVADSNQVSTQVDGEAIILNLNDGQYYGLNPVGARIWSLIQSPVSFQQVLSALQSEYDVEAEPCRRETLSLLENLISLNLIRVVDESAA